MATKNEETRKVTVNLPISLLDGLVREHETLTEVLRQALKEYRHTRACRELMALRGKVVFDMSWQELRGKDEDRDLGRFLKDTHE